MIIFSDMRDPLQFRQRIQVAMLSVEFTFIATSVHSFISFVRVANVDVVVDLLSHNVVFLVVHWVDIDANVDTLVTTRVCIQ